MTPSPPGAAAVILAATLFFFLRATTVQSFGGSSTTVAVSYGEFTTVCSLVADEPTRQIQCWRDGQNFSNIYAADVSFDSIAGGQDTICAVRSGGFSLLCWSVADFTPKRIYIARLEEAAQPLESVTIGDTQVCGLINGTRNVTCWRGDPPANRSSRFRSVSSGSGFSCGVLDGTGRVSCWGSSGSGSTIASEIEGQFGNFSMANVYVGGRHACGVSSGGTVICRGENSVGQLNVPANVSFEYSALALGDNHSCAIRRLDNTVVCWGGNNGEFSGGVPGNVSFESIVAGFNFTCGLVSSNFSVICWGPGWPISSIPPATALPLRRTLPGPCVQTACECGIYPQSQTLCTGNGNICRPCEFPPSPPPPLPPPPPPSSVGGSGSRRGLRRGLLAFAIVGSVGCFAGICTLIYCLWAGVCFGKKKIHNSVQPTINNPPPPSNSSPPSRSSTLRRQGSRLMRRQRSGTSSTKHPDRAEEFLFEDLAAATNTFALENKIGAGSFGTVYKGKLLDGREVAIKRSETGPVTKKFQEKETAFESELSFLSRLHHKHLVRLVGYCEERDERLLVYEYMKNGALYDHLHSRSNVEKSSSVLNSWKLRIKISLDAARGIEYLHNYAVPPIIHRDIKSSNILIDANWTARVSDFGLSLMGPGPDSSQDFRPTKAAGTVGYIDPEYYGLNVLTAKSDVYGLGVVLLEVLTGKRAIFKAAEVKGGEPMSLVDYAVPAIRTGELGGILDTRVGPAEMNEAEAVELVAYTAMHCVNLEGKDRPSMTDIVANLERALTLCDDSHGSISSGPISIVSED